MTAMQIVVGITTMKGVEWQDTSKYQIMLCLVVIMGTVQGFQFLTVCVQLFIGKDVRVRRSRSLACCQGFFMTVLPLVVALCELALLIWFYTQTDKLFFAAWLTINCLLNVFGPAIYVSSLETIRKEQLNTLVSFQYHGTTDEVQANSRVEVDGFRRPLELSDDYYALAFCSNITYYMQRYNITLEEQINYLINVLIIFVMQLVLVFSVFYFIVHEEGQSEGFMAQMHIEVLVVRIVCAFLMHLESEPEVRQALAMFKYGLNQTKTKPTVIDLCRRAFEEIVFIKHHSGNPALFKWLTRDEAAFLRRHKRPVWKADSRGNEFSVTP